MSAQDNDTMEALRAAIPAILATFQNNDYQLTEVSFQESGGGYFWHYALFKFESKRSEIDRQRVDSVSIPFIADRAIADKDKLPGFFADMATAALLEMIKTNIEHARDIRKDNRRWEKARRPRHGGGS